MPEDLKERDSACDYDCIFEVLKLMIGLYVSIVLAAISSIGQMQQQEFGKFAFGFFIDACLLPLILTMIEAFTYRQNFKQALLDFFNSIFYKNGKRHILRGIFGLTGLTILIAIALIFTMSEFITQQYGMSARILIFTSGCIYLGYSFYSATKL